MHHGKTKLPVDMEEFLLAKPFDQHIAIRREQDAPQVLVHLGLVDFAALCNGEQREVMVAEDYGGVRRQRMHQPQGLERLPAPVDQVAAEPQPVRGRVEANPFEQPLQRLVAALQVAYGVGGHQCRVRGTASVNGAMLASNAVPSSASIW
jgi:hypothetical protein